MAAVLALVLVLGGGGASYAAFWTGNKYLEFSSSVRASYAMGAYDAFLVAHEMHEVFDGVEFAWLNSCTEGWTGGQLSAVLDKYFEDRPENRNITAAGQLLYAIGKVCPSAPDYVKV